MPDDEGWLTHLSSGVLSHFQITSANPLHHKGKAKAFKPSLIYYYFQFDVYMEAAHDQLAAYGLVD